MGTQLSACPDREIVEIIGETKEVCIDLSFPRTIRVKGFDLKNREFREYFLKITSKGGLVLI